MEQQLHSAQVTLQWSLNTEPGALQCEAEQANAEICELQMVAALRVVSVVMVVQAAENSRRSFSQAQAEIAEGAFHGHALTP